jgi:two-component system, OmpR family, sensor kinase
MNRLWVRLSLAFGSLILIAAVLIIVFAELIPRPPARNMFFSDMFRERDGLVDTLVSYYRIHESWQGAESIMSGARAILNNTPLSLALADADGQIVYDSPGNVERFKNDIVHKENVLIMVNGKPAGILLVGAYEPNEPKRFEQMMFERMSRGLITFSLIGGALAILLAALVSRGLTSPLSRLAEAARAIGAHNLHQRVEVSGSEEIKEVAYAFNEMAAELQQAEILRRAMVADVAHELRTPLSVLQGNLRAILDDVYPLTKDEVATIYDQTRLMTRLVNDLHELAQAEAGRLELHMQPTDVKALISNTVTIFAPVAEEKEIKLSTEVPDYLPLVNGDAVRLNQVLHNLISNALNHTPIGGNVTIGAGMEKAEEGITPKLRLWIQDNGDGISAEHLPHVFDRFYRADQSRSRATGGAGLGLAIARALIEAHGGQISASSEGLPGKGSTFTILLNI